MPPVRPEHFAYFKDLFEGKATISWNAWFKRHDDQLSQELPRADFLRLKFHKLDEAEKLLRAAGIEFTVSPLAKREKYYSLLYENVLDENGRPKESFRRRAFDGAVGHYLDGDSDKAKATLAGFLRKLKRRPMEKRVEELEALCFDGEMELEYGERELGRMILEQVAALEIGNELLDPAINQARILLGYDRV
jgi:hypothetical protein